MIEIQKISNNTATPVMDSIFLFGENVYTIRNSQILPNSTKKTLTIPAPSIARSCSEIKIKLNFYFHNSF